MVDEWQAEAPGNDGDWIDVRMRKASEAKPIGGATVALLKDAMRSKMADRQLPAGELSKLAKELLAGVVGSAL